MTELLQLAMFPKAVEFYLQTVGLLMMWTLDPDEAPIIVLLFSSWV